MVELGLRTRIEAFGHALVEPLDYDEWLANENNRLAQERAAEVAGLQAPDPGDAET